MDYQNYIKPELLILIPVLLFIGAAFKKSNVKDVFIPLILGAIGVLFAGLYVFATAEINGSQGVATAIFTAFTQGVLCAGAAVYANQIYKQAEKSGETSESGKDK